MTPRCCSAEASWCRMPEIMPSVLGLRWCWERKGRSPPPRRHRSQPENAAATARWSLAPPRESAKWRFAAFAACLPSWSRGMRNGGRYAAAHATVSTGSSAPNSTAKRIILPTLGGRGRCARCLPRRVSLSPASSAPMSSSSRTAESTAAPSGGSTALPRKALTPPSPYGRPGRPSSSFTCRHSSSSGVRLSSGSWNSWKDSSLAALYSL
mmetsp:Transcript_26690/g.91160  ORF Transcript_26690/g.91160 Transcript_26690/m.91160 type:complete len:210 (+) Transcript_26690:593-1222(+)